MGAGKTTAAEFLTDRLHRHGIAARFLPEGPTTAQRTHPLRIGPMLSPVRTAWYDMTIEEYVALSLEKWRAFAHTAEASTAVTVCDGLLFHGNMTDLLLMDADRQALHRYVTGVVESIHGLSPTLIYLRHADPARALRAVCDERGGEWEAMQIAWKVGSPYGVRRGLQGFEGLVALYRQYGATCDDFFAQLALPKVRVVRDGDWARGYGEILAFLELHSSSEASEAQNSVAQGRCGT